MNYGAATVAASLGQFGYGHAKPLCLLGFRAVSPLLDTAIGLSGAYATPKKTKLWYANYRDCEIFLTLVGVG